MALRLLFLCLSFLVAAILTVWIRSYAVKERIMDIPNDRSSHLVATPRGGGMAVVIVFLCAVTVLLLAEKISTAFGMALCGGGILVALIGWLDDRYGLVAITRLIVHLIAAGWAVYWLNGLYFLRLGNVSLYLGWVGVLLSIIAIVWMINLYNFMDGIDGLAGSEAVSVGVIAGALLLYSGFPGLAMVCWAMAAASAGFLIWNWPPARIFMGDVGSGFLGYVFAVLALASENSGGLPLLVWIVLLGVFVTDATVTLIRRLFKGEKLSEAHRSHVYQLAVQNGFSHKQVTLTVLGTNMVLGLGTMVMIRWTNWLLPMTVILALVLISVHIILYKRFSSRLSEGVRRGIEFQLETSQKEAAASYDDGVSECKGGEPGCSKKSPSHPRI